MKTRQKRQVHIQKNRRPAFRILTSGIMLVLLFSTALLYASPSSSPGIAEFLNKDGTLNLDTGFRGSINLAGFRVSIDECLGITAISTPDAVMPPETWSALGSGLNSSCYSLALDGSGNLYAGGHFTSAGGNTANRIAKWDGNTWSALGSGLNNACYSLAFDGSGNLYAAGEFTTAGGNTVNYIAKWDGSTWSALGSGFDQRCNSLAVDGSGNLYAGGDFTTAGGNAAYYIAKWDGSTWSALGSGLNSICYSLAFDGSGSLYAGGNFTIAGGNAANRIAKWDGNTWSTLGSGFNNRCYSLAFDGSGGLYAGGKFTTAGGNAANRIAKWDGNTWSALGSGLNNICYSLAVDGSGNLYAGGSFATAGGNTVNYIAKWDGSAWSALGSGMNNWLSTYNNAIIINGSDLYACGFFTTAGGTAANRVAKWGQVVLPVELLGFQASVQDNQTALLSWKTATETNNHGFEIEHSMDARNWQSIGFEDGQGSSVEMQAYSYCHEYPATGTNYYRLKQMDYDGAFEYSNIESVVVKGKEDGLKIFPNPTSTGTFTLYIPNSSDEKTIIRLYDQAGSLVLEQSTFSALEVLDVQHLSAGVYFVETTVGSTVMREKVLVE